MTRFDAEIAADRVAEEIQAIVAKHLADYHVAVAVIVYEKDFDITDVAHTHVVSTLIHAGRFANQYDTEIKAAADAAIDISDFVLMDEDKMPVRA